MEASLFKGPKKIGFFFHILLVARKQEKSACNILTKLSLKVTNFLRVLLPPAWSSITESMPDRSCTLNLDIKPGHWAWAFVACIYNWKLNHWTWILSLDIEPGLSTGTLNLYIEPGVLFTTLRWRVQVHITQFKNESMIFDSVLNIAHSTYVYNY